MTGTRARQCWVVAISCCTLLGACGDPPPQDAAKQSTATRKAKKPASVVDDMVAAVSAGKSAAAVGVYFSLGNTPTVNTALPIDIAVVPHRPFSSLRAYFSAQDGLTLISGDELQPLTVVPIDKPVEHKLVVMPVKAGVYMVTASLETQGDDGTVSRIFSVPVIVTAADPASNASAPPPAAPRPAQK
jgi:hypothetical protein